MTKFSSIFSKVCFILAGLVLVIGIIWGIKIFIGEQKAKHNSALAEQETVEGPVSILHYEDVTEASLQYLKAVSQADAATILQYTPEDRPYYEALKKAVEEGTAEKAIQNALPGFTYDVYTYADESGYEKKAVCGTRFCETHTMLKIGAEDRQVYAALYCQISKDGEIGFYMQPGPSVEEAPQTTTGRIGGASDEILVECDGEDPLLTAFPVQPEEKEAE